MKQLTIILAHPDFEHSIANKTIIEQLISKYPDADLRALQQLYPDYKIDVQAEQEALLKSDIVLFQYPFYWYNMPAILKQWFDTVLTHNFAYGSKGDKLKGKYFLASITVGGSEDSYSPLGYNHFRVKEFLKNIEQTAYLAQMTYLPPVYGFGNTYIPGIYNTPETVKARALKQAENLLSVLDNLMINDPETIIRKFVYEWFAHFDVFSETDYFLNYLSPDVQLIFQDGEYSGHEGFAEWYSPLKLQLKPVSTHQISNLNVSSVRNGMYEVSLTVLFKAETQQNEKVENTINEKWTLSLTPDDKIQIHKYEAMRG